MPRKSFRAPPQNTRVLREESSRRCSLGVSYRLVLEVFANHPEKLDEMETSNSLDEDFETPLLYEPRP